MRWRTKSKVQNFVDMLPDAISNEMYYFIQRHCGGLRNPNPISRITAGIETIKKLDAAGFDPEGKKFLEIGTGRIPMAPLVYWLIGGGGTMTVDLNRYVKDVLVKEAAYYILKNAEECESIFGSMLNPKRFSKFLEFLRRSDRSSDSILEFCAINYSAPCDATNLQLQNDSIDFYTSYTVLEHIPENVLVKIIEEGNRVVSKSGAFVHQIDYSDHFSHSDISISAINFLQFTEVEWHRLAGNRYMYQNRLRHDDFLNLFSAHKHQLVLIEPTTDIRSLDLLRNGQFALANKYQEKSHENLAIRNAWIVSCVDK